MSEIRLQPRRVSRGCAGGAGRGDRAVVPEPSRIESWLRTLTGFENARVVGVEPLTDGLSNVTCRLKVADGPVTTAVLRIQPTRGIFEPYDVLREGRVLSHLAGSTVPVPGLLAAESDPRFFGSPFLLLESIDAPHMPAPEADLATFAADLPVFAFGARRDPRARLEGRGPRLPGCTEFPCRSVQGGGRDGSATDA